MGPQSTKIIIKDKGVKEAKSKVRSPKSVKPTFQAPQTTHFIVILVLFTLLFATVLLVNTVVNKVPN